MRHRAKHAYRPDVRDFYKFFFLCRESEIRDPGPGPETLAAQFFARDDLPPLSTGRTIEKDIDAAFAFLEDGAGPAVFD